MRRIYSLTELNENGRCAVTLGKFDGLHTGHRELLSRTLMHAKEHSMTSVMMSLDINPRRILTREEKEAMLAATELDVCASIPFTGELMSMEAEDFVASILKKKLHASYICVGDDFRFGYRRAGDPAMLEDLAPRYGYAVEVVPQLVFSEEKDRVTVELHGERDISSTWVRSLLAEGNMEKAAALLGYHYFISGTIVHGTALGRTIGMPTANMIPPEEKLLPRHGVYASISVIDGKEYPGITNIGIKPTVEGQFVGVESHFFNCNEDLYGKTLKTELIHFMRPEKRFASLEELRRQIAEDIPKGRRLLGLDGG